MSTITTRSTVVCFSASRMVAPSSSARDEYRSGTGMRDHGGVDKPLVIGELIDLGRLRLAVQHQAHAKGGAILHDHVLVLGSD